MKKRAFYLTAFLVLITLFATTLYLRVGQIEQDLINRSFVATEKAHQPSTTVLSDGRDVTDAPTAGPRNAVVKVVKAVWGVRAVDDRTSVRAVKKPGAIAAVSSRRKNLNIQSLEWRLERQSNSITMTGAVPDEATQRHLQKRAQTLFPGSVIDETHVAGIVPAAGWRDMADLALAQIYTVGTGSAALENRTLTITGTTDDPARTAQIQTALAQDLPGDFSGVARVQTVAAGDPANEASRLCKMTFDTLLSRRTVRFGSDSTVLKSENNSLLDALAFTASQCPTARIEISGHTDTMGSRAKNLDLSHSRAAAVLAYLKNAGIPDTRMIAVGFGAALPLASNATDEGRARNRRIEVNVRK